MEIQKAVNIFTGLADEVAAFADAQISADTG